MNIDSRKTLITILLVAIVAAVGYLGYIIISQKPGQEFSEFYILNIEGEAGNYPHQIVLGETLDIIIGIVNHEYRTISYRVGLTGYSIDNREMSIGELVHGERFEEVVSLVPQFAGGEQKVEFWLYKNGELEPYFTEPLRLYIDVIEP